MSAIPESINNTIGDISKSSTWPITKQNAHTVCPIRDYSYLIKSPKCKQCGTTNPLDFKYARKIICQKCIKEQKRKDSARLRTNIQQKEKHNKAISEARQRNVNAFLGAAINRLQRKARIRPDQLRNQCNLDLDHILELYRSTGGQCAITNIPMAHRFGLLNSISIDRLDNSIGHLNGNIHLVCKFVNLGRRQHNLNDFIRILKSCTVIHQPIIELNYRDWFRRSLKSIRSRCCGKVNRARKNLVHDLTLDFLCELYQKQTGLCALTGIPMSLSPDTLTTCSVDRIRNDIGYYRDNIQLVCLWSNVAKGPHSVDDFNNILNQINISSSTSVLNLSLSLSQYQP